MEVIPEINLFDPKTEKNSRKLITLFNNLTRQGLMALSSVWLREFSFLVSNGTPIPMLSYGTSIDSEVRDFCRVLSRLLEKGKDGDSFNPEEDTQYRRRLLIEASAHQMNPATAPFMWMYLIHIPDIAKIFDEASASAPLKYCKVNPAFREYLLHHPDTKFEPHYTHPENTALHVAVALDDPELVRAMLKHHNVDVVGFFEDRVISWAVLMRRFNVLPMLLEQKPKLNDLTPAKLTVAHWIAGAWIDASIKKREAIKRVWDMFGDKESLLIPCKIKTCSPNFEHHDVKVQNSIYSAHVERSLPGLAPQNICPEPFSL